MKNKKMRLQIAVLAFIMLPAAAGIVAVNASANCEKFVRTYITKPVRNRVSKSTLAAWAAWRVAHPNWKPNPNVHRPKYIMNREEAVQKVDFACNLPVIPSNADGLLDRALPGVINFTPMGSPAIVLPSEVPPEIAELTPPDEWPPLTPYLPPVYTSSPPPGIGVPIYPLIPPQTPPVSGEVPEPSSLALIATGIGFISMLLAAKMRAQHSD